MANPEHIRIIRQGASVIRAWRKRMMPSDRLDLTQAVIDGAILQNADLRGADLVGAYFASTVFGGEHLKGADVKSTLLNGADLSEAELFGTVRRGVNLYEADLSNARCGWTIFSDINLSRVKGLESVRHRGPSTIGLDSLVCSKGKIPEVFLRGCGLSDWEIEGAKLYDRELSPNEIIGNTISRYKRLNYV